MVRAAQRPRARSQRLYLADLWSLPGGHFPGADGIQALVVDDHRRGRRGGVRMGPDPRAVVAYRRRDPEKMPKQFQSNLPIEVMYTAIPLIIVGFIFFYTVNAENKIDALTPNPAVRIRVTGSQWGWSFSYTNAAGKQIALVETAQKRPPLLGASPLSSEYPRLCVAPRRDDPDNSRLQ